MVRIVLASAVAIAEPTGLRYTRMPIATATIVAMTTDCTTALTCRKESVTSCCFRAETKSHSCCMSNREHLSPDVKQTSVLHSAMYPNIAQVNRKVCYVVGIMNSRVHTAIDIPNSAIITA